MIIPGSPNALMLATGEPCEAYKVKKSVRFNSPDAARFNRTPGASGNRRIWTFSAWYKRQKTGSTVGSGKTETLLSAGTSGFNHSSILIGYAGEDQLAMQFFNGGAAGTQYEMAAPDALRDVASHYHFVVAVDTTQATNTNRVKIWINGKQKTLLPLAGGWVPQNFDGFINHNVLHAIGVNAVNNAFGLDGMLSDVHLIDGQALDATAFGFFCPSTGQWRPKRYGGTYGTQGSCLRFNDGSAATAAALGADSTANANNWTPTNLAVVPGDGCDWLDDTTSNNFATWNFLEQAGVENAGLECLTIIDYSGAPHVHSTMGVQAGKWYYENKKLAGAATGQLLYVGHVAINLFGAGSVIYAGNGQKNVGAVWSSYGSSYTTNDVIGVALDMDAQTVTFYKNGVSQGPISLPSAGPYFAGASDGDNTERARYKANFGQQPQDGGAYYEEAGGWFRYPPPPGHKAMCAGNLPRPSIILPPKFFKAHTFQGDTSVTPQQIILGMQPDLAWIKRRDVSQNHQVHNSVRGPGNALSTNSSAAESSGQPFVQGFNADGYQGVYTNAVPYACWNWKKGERPGVDVVVYTGTGVPRTVPHACGKKPGFILVKALTVSNDWCAYHQGIGATKFLRLTTDNVSTNSAPWNNAEPTAVDFTVGTSSLTNALGVTYVAYVFAEVEGFSKLGTYLGNGSTDGPFVHMGFRPAFAMTKALTGTWNWQNTDSARNPSNPVNAPTHPSLPDAETVDARYDYLSNGLKLRNNAGGINDNGVTYIYASFAEFPFKYANAR